MNKIVTPAARRPLNTTEKVVLGIVFILMIIGIIAAFVNDKWFVEKYVVEDGFIEDLTLVPLALLVIISVTYLIKYSRKKNIWFFLTYAMIALGSFFVLGEEISWGQRIFNFQTSEYFKEHNTQDEENIHNLVLDGERLNKIIFTDVLVAGVAVYLIVFPIVYSRNSKFKDFIDRSAIPIASFYQIIACLLIFAMSFLTFYPDSNVEVNSLTQLLSTLKYDTKGAELLEFGGSTVFMLIVPNPLNKYARSLQLSNKN